MIYQYLTPLHINKNFHYHQVHLGLPGRIGCWDARIWEIANRNEVETSSNSNKDKQEKGRYKVKINFEARGT